MRCGVDTAGQARNDRCTGVSKGGCDLMCRIDEVAFVWIPAHAGNRHNDLADKLACRVADTQQPATGMNSAALADPVRTSD